jgi:hypothetical protein
MSANENGSGVLFEDLDALLDASMDDIEDLPPQGVPPSGHYNLTVTFGIKEIGDEGKEVIAATYVVDAINELKDPEDAAEVALKQEFVEFFHITKKDGTANKWGIGKLKQRLNPYVERLNTKNVRELVNGVNGFAIAATVKRTVNRKNEDQFNMDLKDVVVL